MVKGEALRAHLQPSSLSFPKTLMTRKGFDLACRDSAHVKCIHLSVLCVVWVAFSTVLAV
jgi:hypothetical protein